MHGPYRIIIRIDRQAPAEFTSKEAGEAAEQAGVSRFYNGGGRYDGTLEGAKRNGAFCAAYLLQPGQEATVDIIGRDGPEKPRPCRACKERARRDITGVYCYDCQNTGTVQAREQEAVGSRVRRDEAGRCYMTLGSRWQRERHFVGV